MNKRIILDNELIVIIDILISVGYIFFVNFFNYVNASERVFKILFVTRMIAIGVFLIIIVRIVLSNKAKRQNIFIYAVLVSFVIAANYLLFPENNSVFVETSTNFISTVFSISLLFFLINDYDRLIKYLRVYSLFIALFLVVELLWKGVVFNNGRYSMALGYICLLPAMTLVLSYKTRRQTIDLIGVILIVLSITLYASRGPLLCIILYIALLVLRDTKAYVKISVIVLTCILYASFDDIMRMISNAIPSLGSSRTFLYVLNNQISEDSGRIEMYGRVIQAIRMHPFAIKGINADYAILGVYTHNILLELLYEFGILIGGIWSVVIVIKCIHTCKKSKASMEGEVCLMFMMMSIPQLMVSHTIWTEWSFWVWMLLSLKSSHDHHDGVKELSKIGLQL